MDKIVDSTLRTLTEQLPPIPRLKDMVSNLGANRNYIEYKVKNGTSIGFGLLNQREVAVQKLFISAGTTFPTHRHSTQMEYGIIFVGELEITIDNEVKKLTRGDCIKFDPNTNHTLEAITDSWLITIAVPKIEGYPS